MLRSRPEAQAEHVGLEPWTDADRAADAETEDGMTKRHYHWLLAGTIAVVIVTNYLWFFVWHLPWWLA
jgi:uncharacterized membrane protein YdbT with pleckstrin-like domain